MDWVKLLEDNFTAILAVLGALGGVAIGYWGQSLRDKRQRKWDLDNKRRERVRIGLLNLLEEYKSISSVIFELETRKILGNQAITGEELTVLVKKTSDAFVFIGKYEDDQEIKSLGDEYISELKDFENIDLNNLQRITTAFRQRIDELINRTYNPNYEY